MRKKERKPASSHSAEEERKRKMCKVGCHKVLASDGYFSELSWAL